MAKGSVTQITNLEGMSVWGVLGLLSMVLISLAGCLYLYQRQLQKSVRAALRQEVMLEVKTQMQVKS